MSKILNGEDRVSTHESEVHGLITGTGHYATIQATIAGAAIGNGDAVVTVGSYDENLFVPTGINVMGTGINCILDGNVFVELGGTISGLLVKSGNVIARTGATTAVEAPGDLTFENHFKLEGHGLNANDRIVFAETYGNIVAGTAYFVLGGEGILFNDRFMVSLTSGGAAIALIPHTNRYVKVTSDSLIPTTEDELIEARLSYLDGAIYINPLLSESLVLYNAEGNAGDISTTLAAAQPGERVEFTGTSISGDVTIPAGITFISKFQGATISGDVTLGAGAHIIGFKIGGAVSGTGFTGFSEIRVGASDAAMFSDINKAIASAGIGSTIYLEAGEHLIEKESTALLGSIAGDLFFVGAGAEYTGLTFEEQDESDRFIAYYQTNGGTLYFDGITLKASNVQLVFGDVSTCNCSWRMNMGTLFFSSLDVRATYKGLSFEVAKVVGNIYVGPTKINIFGLDRVAASYIYASYIRMENNGELDIGPLILDGAWITNFLPEEALVIRNHRKVLGYYTMYLDNEIASINGTNGALIAHLVGNSSVDNRIWFYCVELNTTLGSDTPNVIVHDLPDTPDYGGYCYITPRPLAGLDTRPHIDLVMNAVTIARSAWTKVGGFWEHLLPVPLNSMFTYTFGLSGFQLQLHNQDDNQYHAFINSKLSTSLDGTKLRIASSPFIDVLMAMNVEDILNYVTVFAP